MIDKIFFDTNLIVYLFDKSEKNKQKSIKDLLLKRKIDSISCISLQVINEFINVVTKKIENPVGYDQVKKLVKNLNNFFTVFPLSMKDSETALELVVKYKYSYWDSLILSSALNNECTILYSEDLHHYQTIDDSLKIIDPFKD